jgi:hypothetical protein
MASAVRNVDEGGQRHRQDGFLDRFQLLPLLGQDRVVDLGELVEGGQGERGLAQEALEGDHQPDVVDVVADLEELSVLRLAGDEEQLRLGVVEGVLDLFGGVGRVDRHGDGAGAQDPHVGDHPAGPVLRQDGHLVTGLDAELSKPACHHERAVVKLPVAEGHPLPLFPEPDRRFPLQPGGALPEQVGDRFVGNGFHAGARLERE